MLRKLYLFVIIIAAFAFISCGKSVPTQETEELEVETEVETNDTYLSQSQTFFGIGLSVDNKYRVTTVPKAIQVLIGEWTVRGLKSQDVAVTKVTCSLFLSTIDTSLRTYDLQNCRLFTDNLLQLGSTLTLVDFLNKPDDNWDDPNQGIPGDDDNSFITSPPLIVGAGQKKGLKIYLDVAISMPATFNLLRSQLRIEGYKVATGQVISAVSGYATVVIQ